MKVDSSNNKGANEHDRVHIELTWRQSLVKDEQTQFNEANGRINGNESNRMHPVVGKVNKSAKRNQGGQSG